MAKVFVGADVIKGYIGIESGGGENEGTGKMSIQQIDEIKKRSGVCEFRVRIEPENYASQRFIV